MRENTYVDLVRQQIADFDQAMDKAMSTLDNEDVKRTVAMRRKIDAGSVQTMRLLIAAIDQLNEVIERQAAEVERLKQHAPPSAILLSRGFNEQWTANPGDDL